MNSRALSEIATFVSLIIGVTLFNFSCKDDESPISPGGGGGLTTFSFGTTGQTITIPASGGLARARLTGALLPYTITGGPNPSVATAAIRRDTLFINPVQPGHSAVTITDSLYAHYVTIELTVTGSGGGNFGWGTVTTTSSAGNLNISGTGVWPPQAGPSVIAMYDTTVHVFMVYGYVRVTGPNYNILAVGGIMPAGVVPGTYNHPQISFGAVYDADTLGQTDSLAYQSVSGSVTVSSIDGRGVVGTYSVMARKGSAQAIPFTGTFDVVYAVGVLPDW